MVATMEQTCSAPRLSHLFMPSLHWVPAGEVYVSSRYHTLTTAVYLHRSPSMHPCHISPPTPSLSMSLFVTPYVLTVLMHITHETINLQRSHTNDTGHGFDLPSTITRVLVSHQLHVPLVLRVCKTCHTSTDTAVQCCTYIDSSLAHMSCATDRHTNDPYHCVGPGHAARPSECRICRPR